MKHQDELDLWKMVKDLHGPIEWEKWFEKLNIPIKRGYSIIAKWDDTGILDYGVSLRYAWIEDKSKMVINN